MGRSTHIRCGATLPGIHYYVGDSTKVCIGRHRFLHLVEVVLVCRQDAQPDRLRDGGRDHPGQAEREGDDNDYSQHLLPQQMTAAAIK